ncbi:alcohol dehydrogenase, propanol-preferring [Saccharopolyspora antimicrobica]|uniref:alcohol dehydrogenase n=2 Tax=Saccharopolyspora antimicrobica TaxID=455193 RepID=A0A1I4X6F1_9PSEU|nr:propanol-preferring alcohol dehydrogenase [Saccharopolyspora antimicrobica]SFN21083.1 alcohol dehydrogenase, propanol-preferring [Saccharopolyspora antimicrobica]
MGQVMKAVQYQRVGERPVVVEVPRPEPGPGQVLLQVTAAGMCHSDIEVMSWPADVLPFELPLTLGHEGVGTVAALGPGVRGVSEGESVAVYGPWGCGVCRNCAQGKENYCTRAGELGIRPPGLGAPGAMAEYLLVDDVRHLVPLDGLDPVQAAPLTDAGLTPYHAIKRSVPKLVGGSTAVVIGAGGLGHLAVQILRATTGARVIALDVADERLELAREVGAHDVARSDESAPERIRELTDGLGADVVLDFVGIAPTVKLAAQSVAIEGDITIVGIAGAPLPVGFGLLPHEVSVASPYWGSRAELIEVLDLARSGALRAHVETFGLDETPEVYERFHAGEITGRAVIVP